MRTPLGIWVFIESSSARTALATLTVLVPGCRCTARTIARTPLNQLALRLFSTSSSTRPSAPSSTDAPFRYTTVIDRNSAALFSWPVAWIVYAVVGPHSTPVGWLTLCELTAVATSSIPIFRYASAVGSSWMRTAYLADPNTCTCATPSTIERRCDNSVSPTSSSCCSESVVDVSA